MEKIKEIIENNLKKHDINCGVADYNSTCHLLMYLRQDGWQQHTDFSLDTMADIIEYLYTNNNVPPIVSLKRPSLRN